MVKLSTLHDHLCPAQGFISVLYKICFTRQIDDFYVYLKQVFKAGVIISV